MIHREIQLVTLEDYVMKESENNEDSYTQVGEILVGTLNMKRAMQEIIRILLILTIQILIGVLLSCLIDEKWNFKNLFWNYGFIIFWSSYIVVSISCTFRINGAPFPRQRCKRLAPAVRYPFVVTC